MADLQQRLRLVLDPVGTPHQEAPAGARSAAVLMLFDRRDPALPLLFVERTTHLRHHAGQIGFPGGGSEPGESVVATALREAAEEAAVPPAAVEVIGVLPPFMTATSDNWLTPVAGVRDRDIDFRPEPFEVARLFHVSLRTLIEAPHTVRELSHDGLTRRVHFYDVDGTVSWGVTGAIIAELIARLDAPA